MKGFILIITVAVIRYCSLVTTTKSSSSKPFKLDLNLPPPDENEDAPLHHSPIRSDPNLVNVPMNSRSGRDRFGVVENLQSFVSNEKQDGCEFHHPGCIVWKTLSKNEKNKERQRSYRRNQTEEQRLASRIASKGRKKKFYDKLGKEGKEAYLRKNAESRKNRLERMSVMEKKEWYKKNNSYCRKPSKPSSPR